MTKSLLLGIAAVVALSAQEPQALLNRYCITCHNAKLKTAGLEIDKLDLHNASPNAETWEKVVRKLRAGMMPPAGAPRPDRHALDALAGAVEDALDQAAAANPNPGRAPLHRMNRGEYANAIRDLLAIDVDPTTLLPADDSSNGFDNIADVLGVSPALLERYVSAAAKISRLAVGDPETAPLDVTYTVRGGSQPSRNSGWPAARHARRHPGPSQLSAGRRVSHQALADEAELRPGIRRRRRGPGTRSHSQRPAREVVPTGTSADVLHASQARRAVSRRTAQRSARRAREDDSQHSSGIQAECQGRSADHRCCVLAERLRRQRRSGASARSQHLRSEHRHAVRLRHSPAPRASRHHRTLSCHRPRRHSQPPPHFCVSPRCARGRDSMRPQDFFEPGSPRFSPRS